MGCCGRTDFSPAADAELGTAQRVNYSAGMVLGVDDFRQEHAWLAGRDKRALRETIGYGVLAGLGVSVPPGDAQATVHVQPGLALAPDGRLVAVTGEQCASLAEWLATHPHPALPPDRAVQAWVLLAYDETLGTPVPIPGEPCRDESAQQADSRWSDSFRLSLSWTPPVHAEEAALKRFTAWLRAIPVRDVTDGEALQTAFRNAVEALTLADDTPPPATLVLPRAQYRAYLDVAFDIWVHQLRAVHMAPYGPVQLSTGAGSQESERALALARIDCTLGTGGTLGGEVTVQTLGNPLLLHLRLLQEWLVSHPEDDAPYDATYVLGRGDERLPHAQDLLQRFFGTRPEAERTERGPMARVDRAGGSTREAKALLTPAVKHPGKKDDPADYYGPGMSAPILVTDGGTGQAAEPKDGQLLVGRDKHFVLADLVAGSDPPSLSVAHGRAGHPDDLVLDTVQPLHKKATPAFAGMTLSGTSTSPPSPALQVTGGATVDVLQIGALGPAILAADRQHRVVEARRWDGEFPEERDPPPLYYGPAQTAPVRIEDGGTGLDALPAPLQVLVGRNDTDKRAYVLAGLAAGPNASIVLSHVDTPPLTTQPSQRLFTLTIDAKASGGMNVAAAPNGSVSVAVQDNTATLDTVQPLRTTAAPTFAALSLSKPNQSDDPTHRLGWNSKTHRVVASNAAARSALRLVRTQAEAVVQPTDEVLVFAGDAAFKLTLPDPLLTDGRTLVVKVLPDGKGVAVQTTDFGDLQLNAAEAMTLVASRDLRQWLLVSVLRRG